MCVAEATRRLAACQKIHRLVGEDPDLTVQQRHVDMTATPPNVAVAQRREDGNRRIDAGRSEEHTSELQSLMRNSYDIFCLKKKINRLNKHHYIECRQTTDNENQ